MTAPQPVTEPQPVSEPQPACVKRTNRAKLGTIQDSDGSTIVVTYYPATRTIEFRPFKARHAGPRTKVITLSEVRELSKGQLVLPLT